MKQFLLLFVLTTFSTGLVQSQITINSDDIIAIGYVADQTTDTLPAPSILEGGVGNINWDFTALAPGLDAQFVFLEPDSTPYAASFPEANLSSRVMQDLFAYMIKDNDKIEIIGFEGIQNFAGFIVEGLLTLTPGQSLIRFPATFGESYQESIVRQGQVPGSAVGFPTIDSLRLIVNVERSVEIDAYGTMETPSGSYNTIRSTETETSVTNVLNLNNGQWVPFLSLDPDTVINYNWWTKENGLAFPVVQLEFNPSNNSRKVVWLKTLTNVENLFAFEATLFPNPASHYLNLEFQEPFYGSAEIYHLHGGIVKRSTLSGSMLEKIDVGNIGTGVYVLILRDKNGHISGHQKIGIFK